VKMEDAAREATSKPIEAALDIINRLALNDRARAVRSAIIEEGSQRRAAKKLRISQPTISRIFNLEIIPAYARAGIPPERTLLLRPSNCFRQAPNYVEEGDDPKKAKVRDLYQKRPDDARGVESPPESP